MKKVLIIMVVELLVIILINSFANDIYAKRQWDIQFEEYKNRPIVVGSGNVQNVDETGYTEVLDMDYITQEGVGVKVDSILMTDDCIDVKVSFKFEDNIEVNSKSFAFGYVIYDNDKNVYVINPRIRMTGNLPNIAPFIFEELGVKYNKEDIYSNLLCDSDSMGNIEANVSERTIKSSFKIRAKDSFPRTKKLYIKIFDLGYSMIDIDTQQRKIVGAEDFKINSAEWLFGIDIPEKIYERQTLYLKLAEDIPGFEPTRITLTETGLVIKFKSKEYIDLIFAGKDMASNDFAKARDNMLYISDGEGKRYLELSGGTTFEKNGYKMTLEACKNDLNKKLYVNFNINGEQYTSELIEQ